MWERPSARAIAREILALFEAPAPLGTPASPGPDPTRSRQVVADAASRQAHLAPISRSLRPFARSFQIASFVASLKAWPSGITAPPSCISESLTLFGGAAVV